MSNPPNPRIIAHLRHAIAHAQDAERAAEASRRALQDALAELTAADSDEKPLPDR